MPWKIESRRLITRERMVSGAIDIIRFATEEMGHEMSKAIFSGDHENETIMLTLRAEPARSLTIPSPRAPEKSIVDELCEALEPLAEAYHMECCGIECRPTCATNRALLAKARSAEKGKEW